MTEQASKLASGSPTDRRAEVEAYPWDLVAEPTAASGGMHAADGHAMSSGEIEAWFEARMQARRDRT